jgi:hypothetical protein
VLHIYQGLSTLSVFGNERLYRYHGLAICTYYGVLDGMDSRRRATSVPNDTMDISQVFIDRTHLLSVPGGLET